MLKRFSTVLLSAGLFLGLTPAAASAAYDLEHHRDNDHYRCMYHCGERHGSYHRYRHDRHRYCWYRDRYGWYWDRCHHHHHGDDGGGYDSHRHHPR